MWAGGTFYYCHVVLVNIINCVKKGCNGPQIHTQDNTSAIEWKSMKKICTTAFYILATSIKCSLDRLFHNKMAAEIKKENAGESEKPLI